MSSNVSSWLRWLALLALTTVPFLTRLTVGRTSHDIDLFWTSGSAVLHGAIPYADVPLEYPPYALIWFVGPAAVSSSLAEFRVMFGLLIWAIDAGVKGWLLWQIPRVGTRARDFVPIGAYSLGTAALGHLLLQRYDLIPAAISLAALLALWRGWTRSAGVLVAIAAGTKVYPALFIPVMAVCAWRRGRPDLGRFGTGVLIGLLPLLVVSWWMPWWQFVAFQANRGLQVESLWASIVWMLHFANVPARWEFISAWNEVTGRAAEALVGPGRAVWILATLLSVGRAALTARDLPSPAPLGSLALLMLLPTVSFVAFNTVLSPQFHLWLLPWCAIALAAGDLPGFDARLARRAAWCIVVANMIVPVFYPHRTYTSGLDVGRTAALLFRNGLLVYASVCLWLSAQRAILTKIKA